MHSCYNRVLDVCVHESQSVVVQSVLDKGRSIKMAKAWTVLIIVVLAFWKCHGQTYPFMNTSLSFEDRVKVCVATPGQLVYARVYNTVNSKTQKSGECSTSQLYTI